MTQAKNNRAVLSVRLILVLALGVSLTACGIKRSGGFFQNDGPPRIPRNMSNVKDAIPRTEPLAATGNKPYTALGKSYTPMTSADGFSETGMASWYGRQFHGRRTSSGERYDMFKMTAAHPTLPLPSYVRVRNLDNRREVVVRVNDRGPFLNNRVIDMSYAAAHKLGFAKRGTARVQLSVVTKDDGVRELPVGKATVAVRSDAVKQVAATRSDTQETRHIYVQVGAFREIGNAYTMKQQLLSLGYRPVVVDETAIQVQSAGPALYRVRLGPIAHMDDANLLLDKLSRERLGAPRLIVETQ